MRTLYLDCSMGAAGDMLAGSLLELVDDREGFLRELNDAGIPGVVVSADYVNRCCVRGTHFTVTVHGEEEHQDDDHHHHHHHHGSHDTFELIDTLCVPEAVKADIKAVYELVISAESRVHGVPVTEVHMHELGNMDALADITAVCLLISRLSPLRILASPVNFGGGTVRCAHGVLPVPAPATALLLEGVPAYEGDIKTELCTPTGAALLRHFATGFVPMPVMVSERVGIGMGSKELPRMNGLRAFLSADEAQNDDVRELECNLDDMTGEDIAFACELLMERGALDVYTESIYMKKGRPGIRLCCLCKAPDAERMRELIFEHTSTLGVRQYSPERFSLSRERSSVETTLGAVRVKSAVTPGGTVKSKPEYDDLARIAHERSISIAEARRMAADAAKAE